MLTPTFRYHPAVIAQAFATLGVLYPGRMILGVGSGESLNEVPLGLEWPDGKERFARLKEAVTLIRELWTGERVSFEGTYYRTDKATIYDRPEVPVPIYIGASGPAATRLAGRVADGFITTSGKARLAVLGHPAAGAGRRRRQGRPDPGRPRPADRDEGLLRPGQGDGRWRTPSTGARWR